MTDYINNRRTPACEFEYKRSDGVILCTDNHNLRPHCSYKKKYVDVLHCDRLKSMREAILEFSKERKKREDTLDLLGGGKAL